MTVDYIKPDDAGDIAGGGLAAKLESGNSDVFVFNFAKGLLFDLTITGAAQDPILPGGADRVPEGFMPAKCADPQSI